MASAGSVFVDLLLRDQQFHAGMQRASRGSKQAFGQIQRDASGAAAQISAVLSPVNSLSSALRGMAGIAATALSVRSLVEYSDTWRQVQGRLSLVTKDSAELARTQEALIDIAERTRQPLEAVSSFYARLVQFVPEAERAQYDFLGVTENVNTALAITGEASASAAAAMVQFTQAIGTNFEAAGQELRSLQEQAPRLTKALMDALGGGTKTLQQLKEEGLLTRESVLNALAGMGEEGKKMAAELARVPVSVRQSFTQLDNAFLAYIGKSDEASAATTALASAVQFLARNVDEAANILGVVAVAAAAKFTAGLAAKVAGSIAATRAQIALTASVLATAKAENAVAVQLASVAPALAVVTGNKKILTAANANLIKTTNALTAAQAGLVTWTGRLATAGRTLLSVFGGAFGIALTAAAVAVAYLATQKSDLEKANEKQIASLKEIADLNERLKTADLDEAQRIRARREEIVAETKERLNNASAILAQLQAQALASTRGMGAGQFGSLASSDASGKVAAQMRLIRQEAEALNQQLNEIVETDIGAELERQFSALPDIFGRTLQQVSELTKEQLKAYDSLKKLASGLRQQIDTQGMSAAATMRYRIENGDLAESFRTAGEQAAYLRDVLIGLAAQQDALTASAERKSAAEGIEKSIASLRQEVETYGMAADAVLAYRIEQGDLAEAFKKAGSAAEDYREQWEALVATQMKREKDDRLIEILKEEEQTLYGLSDAYTALLRRMEEIANYREEYPEMGEVWDALEKRADEAFKKRHDKLKEDNENFFDWAKAMEEINNDAMVKMKDSLAEFLFDPFSDGLSGMLEGFGEMLRKMAAEALAAQIMSSIFGGGNGGGGGGILGFAGNLMSLIPGFSVGSYRVPRDMVANIHKDEMIIPAAEARQIRTGAGFGGGGTIVNQYISTPDANSFNASKTQIARNFKRGIQTA